MSQKNFTPDKSAMLAHLTELFGDCGLFHDGKIEIAYCPPDSRSLSRAEYFDPSDLNAAADFAANINATDGVNVYVGAALRSPSVAPFGRSNSNDYYASNYVWVDFDAAGSAKAAKDKYADLPPSFVVVTGRHPDLRAQAWWRLNAPETDKVKLKSALAGACQTLGGDKAVVDSIRVMRLAGSIAWPKKDGRVTEMTEFATPSKRTQSVAIDDIINQFPFVPDPVDTAAQGGLGLVSSGPLSKSLNISNRRSYDDVREILSYIDPDIPYQEWVAVGMALQNEGYPFALWDEWSRGGTKYDAKTIGTHWRSFHAGGGVSFGTVYKWASERGYAPRMNATHIYAGKPIPQAPSDMREVIDDDTGEVIELDPDMYYIKGDAIEPSIDCSDFVQGTLTDGALSVVYGPSNCGKTFFMTDLAFHVAEGREWRGRRVEQGGVIYTALEGAFGIKNRVAAYQKKTGSRLDKFAIVPCNVDFFNPDNNIEKFIHMLSIAKKDLGSVRLIVVDTLARALAGGDENSGKDMGMIVHHADRIRAETGAHVCFVHHSGKDDTKGARGHSSLRAAVDTEIEVSKNQSEDFSRVKFVKQREMEMGKEIQFKLEVVELGNNRHGEPVTSCVVAPVEKEATAKARLKVGSREQIAFDLISDLVSQVGHERHGKDIPKGVRGVTREQIATCLEARGIISEGSKRQDLSRIITKLIEKKVAVQVGDFVWLSA